MSARRARRNRPFLGTGPVARYVHNGTEQLQVLEEPTVTVRELLRAAGVTLVWMPVGILIAAALLWMLWVGHDMAAAHALAVSR